MTNIDELTILILMSNNYLKLLFICTFCIILSSLSIRNTYASTIFEDNFDQYSSNTFPTKWINLYLNENQARCNASWNVNNSKLNLFIENQGSCTTNITPSSIYWPNNLNNYTYEMDATFVTGTDHNIIFRYDPISNNFYEIHFVSPGDFDFGFSNYVTNYKLSQNYPDDKTYHIIITINGRNIKVIVNNTLVRDITLNADLPPGKIALRAGTGSDPNSGIIYDNIKVTDYNNEYSSLPVPYLSQTNPIWGKDEYDHSQSLGFNPYTFDRWGCAVTSATMILNYYGFNHLPDSSPLTPGSLNQWLNNSQGYDYGIGSDGNYSYLNFAKIASLTHLLSSQNSSLPDLEWIPNFGKNPNNDTLIDKDISAAQPDIIRVTNAQTSSHFVVTTGKTASSYSINDPYWKYSDLTSFNNTYDAIEQFVPSHTNLSYITLVINPSVQILLNHNQQNNGKIYKNGQFSSYNDNPQILYQYEPPINNTDTSGKSMSLGTGVNSLLVPKPENGMYTIMLSSPKTVIYTLNLDTFQTEGSSKSSKIIGILTPNSPQTLVLNFNSDSPTTISATVTIDSTISDIKSLYSLKKINLIQKSELLAILQDAKAMQKSKFNIGYLTELKFTLKLLNTQKKNMTNEAFNILYYDLTTLTTN